MQWTTLVSADDLAAELGHPELVVVDCRYNLRDRDAGAKAWRTGHIQGAVYADLERDLSDLSKKGRGRHPLPEATDFCARLGEWGISAKSQVVAYDAGDSAVASRFWWMLRLLGHARAAVLDGGVSAWLAAGNRLEARAVKPVARTYTGRWRVGGIASTAVVAARAASGDGLLVDARAADRFQGAVEPLDKIAGHIPGAINRPYFRNLGADGRFKTPAQLAREFDELLDGREATSLVSMCGSGVTACHHVLALDHAGRPGARVYSGSWSEWIDSPARPVARA